MVRITLRLKPTAEDVELVGIILVFIDFVAVMPYKIAGQIPDYFYQVYVF